MEIKGMKWVHLLGLFACTRKTKPAWAPFLRSSCALLILFSSTARSVENYTKDLVDYATRDTPVALKSFNLTDHLSQAFTLERLQGKWSFVFFGYTNCPDVCPTTLSELSKVAKATTPKPPMRSNIQYVFVSVDPKRDTPKTLAQYIQYFDSEFIAVTGKENELHRFTKQLKSRFSYQTLYADEYAVNHTAALLLIDPKARYYARFPAPHYADDITKAIKYIQLQTNNSPN